jgi:hypothetical protein
VAKPFSIQSPEDIAKEYAGNKQKIAQAMQMGIVDPTAGVLAGMFIDRMRSAQMQEGAPQATVAQQVMGGAPPASPTPPLPVGGLGGTPVGAPPMAPPAPDMGMAPPMPAMPAPQGAPMGMADGGLASLPVPDAMFDEPTNGGFDDGYAGGGIVAFADGGPTGGWGDYIEQMVRKLDPNIQISGRARTPARNAEVGGVPDSFHLIDAARDIRTPDGMDKATFIAQLKSVFGPDYDVIPSKGRSVHVEPGPKLGEKVRGGARPSNAPAVMPERDIGTAEGRGQSFEDIYRMMQSQYGRTEKEKEVEAKVLARAEEMASPEYYEQQRKASMWETLAEVGFNMASSKSPFLLQAVGEAAAAAMPGAKVARKEREQLKDRALDIMQAMNDKSRKENREILGLTFDAYKTGLSQEQFKETMDLKRDELAQVRALALAELDAKTQAALAKATGKSDGGTELDRIAQTIFDRYRLLQRQGKYVHDRGDPNDISPGMQVAAQEIKVRAYKEAAELLGKGGGDGGFAPGLSPAGGGAAPAGGDANVLDYSQLQ